MKKTISIFGMALLTISSASAAISFSTTTAVGLQSSLGVAIPTGTLVLLVVDNGNDGFLNLGAEGRIPVASLGTASLTSVADRGVALANASITTGQSFGGDLILGAFNSAGGGSIAAAFNGSIAGNEGKNFAIIWFEKSAATLAGGLAGERYGIASGADWQLPAADSGAYTFNGTTNTTTSVYWQLASATSAAQIGATGFFTGTGTAGAGATKTAAFMIVPEPSAALLGAIGVLGLLRRRRN